MNPYKVRLLRNANDEKLDGKRKKERDADARINAEIKAALSEFEGYRDRQAAFQRLLVSVQSRTRLLKPTPGDGSAGWVGPVFLIRRLKNLAARQAHWLHPCETWEPPAGNLRPVFRSLASHLLTRYSAPACMDSAWDVDGPEGFRQQSWYIRLSRGASIRALNLPLALTRNMAHHFRHAPDHCTVIQALCYGEVRGMGGSEELAREVARGKLGQQIQHANFWRTVLCFFVTHPEMQLEYVNPIIDFIHYNKFAGEEVLAESGTVNRPPPWPDFSINGRTLNSIMRMVRRWHGDLSRAPGQTFSWRKSSIPEYCFLDKRNDHEDDLHWTIRELLDSGTLHAEGQTMHHCVYSYAPRCRRGETTIWSLRLRVKDQEKRMATIEVDPRRRSIIHVRDKFNCRPGARSRQIILQWADWAGLKDEWCI